MNIDNDLVIISDASCSNLTLDHLSATDDNITVTIKKLPSGIARAIVCYAEFIYDVWVERECDNLRLWQTRTFSSLVPGSKHRITAWGLSGGNTNDRRRCQSPTVEYLSTPSQSECLQDLQYII